MLVVISLQQSNQSRRRPSLEELGWISGYLRMNKRDALWESEIVSRLRVKDFGKRSLIRIELKCGIQTRKRFLRVGIELNRNNHTWALNQPGRQPLPGRTRRKWREGAWLHNSPRVLWHRPVNSIHTPCEPSVQLYSPCQFVAKPGNPQSPFSHSLQLLPDSVATKPKIFLPELIPDRFTRQIHLQITRANNVLCSEEIDKSEKHEEGREGDDGFGDYDEENRVE